MPFPSVAPTAHPLSLWMYLSHPARKTPELSVAVPGLLLGKSSQGVKIEKKRERRWDECSSRTPSQRKQLMTRHSVLSSSSSTVSGVSKPAVLCQNDYETWMFWLQSGYSGSHNSTMEHAHERRLQNCCGRGENGEEGLGVFWGWLMTVYLYCNTFFKNVN